MVTLDTNPIIYYLKKEVEVVSVLSPLLCAYPPPFVASVTELELFSAASLTPADVAEIEFLLTMVAVIPLDSQIARIAARIRREHKLKVPDSVIAATALFTHSTLVTRNTRDFKKISGLALQRV